MKATTEATVPRRKYHEGRCDDCSRRDKNVTRIIFWVNGYQMTVCADCIKPYRPVILKVTA